MSQSGPFASVRRSTRPSMPSGARYGTRPDPIPRRYSTGIVQGELRVSCSSPCAAGKLRSDGRPPRRTAPHPAWHCAASTLSGSISS